MYFFFILFSISLLAIAFMIGRKLVLLNSGKEYPVHHTDEMFLSKILDFDRIKYLFIENLKKMEHAVIWIIIKAYLISSNFINKKRREIMIKIKSKFNKPHNNDNSLEKKEVSKYIKIISEYKEKVRKIKHRIKEEEGIE